MSPVLQHLGMGLGLGALGFLLVIGVRASEGVSARGPAALASVDLAAAPSAARSPEDSGPARPLADAAPSRDAAPDVAPAPPPPPIFRVAQLAGDSTLALVDGTVGHRPFLAALAAAGLAKAESYRVLHALLPIHDLNHTSPADAFHFAKQKANGRVVAFEYVTSPIDVFQARDDGGTLSAKKLDLHLETRKVATLVTVGPDLKASLAKAGLEEDMLPRLDDALDGHAELPDIHAGSRLRILATEARLAGAFLRYASIDALEYTPAVRGAPPLRVYRFPAVDLDRLPMTSTGHGGSYYDAKGQEPFHGGWRVPVPSGRIASRFNPRRMHPVLHVVMPHNGVDFAAPPGTPIYAAASGTVKTVGDSGPCGNMVQIEHTPELVSSYCHMSRFAAGIHAGQRVESRQLIGYVGQTGRATGPHLHFAIKRNGVFIDPLAMKLDGVRVVPPAHRDEFDAARAALDKALDAIAMEPLDPGSEPAPPEHPDGGPDAGPDDQVFDDTPLP